MFNTVVAVRMEEGIELDDLGAGDKEERDEEAADEKAADDETRFFLQHLEEEQAGVGVMVPSLQRELLQSAVDDYYDALAKREEQPPIYRDVSNFELDRGVLRLRDYPNINIVDSNGKPLALSTIAGKHGGRSAIRDKLHFESWGRRKLPSPIQAQFEKVADEANAAATTDDPDSIAEFVDRINSGVDVAAAAFPTGVDTAAQTTEPLPLREILGLNESLKTIRTTKAVQESKKVSLQQLLEGYREELEQPGTTERADQIEREIQKAEDQLRAVKDSIDTLNQESRSQARQIRDSLYRVLDKNTTLAERIRTLFREQGVTIVSILTAFGMAISTLVLALTGGGAAVAPVTTLSSGNNSRK